MVAHDGCSYSCDGGEYRGGANMFPKDSTSDDITNVSDRCGTCKVEKPRGSFTITRKVVDGSGTSHQDKDWPKVVGYCDELLKRMTTETALEYIVKKDEPDMKALKYFLEYVSYVHDNVLSLAVRKNKLAVVSMLLDHDVDPNQGDALGCAVTSGNQEIVSLLLNKGADPNHFSRSFVYTGFVLGIAVKDGRMDIMKLLLDRGADIKEDFVLGCTTGRNSMHQKMILLQRPDHTKTGAVSICTFICTFILLSHHFEKAEQERWQDDSFYRTVLNAQVKRSFFNGAPSKWTFDDQPVFSETGLLLNYNIPNTEKCIQPKGETNVDIAPPDSKDFFSHIFNENITQFVTDQVFVTCGLFDAMKCMFKDLGSDFESEFETPSLKMTKINTKMLTPICDSSKIEEKTTPCDEHDVNAMDTSAFHGCKLHLKKINIEKLSAMWHSVKGIEGLECDTLDTGENWTKDSIQLESTSDEECPDRNKLLPSKTASEDDEGELLRIENEDLFGSEQITRFTEMNRRLETYIPLSNIDCDLFAEAGFFFRGDSFVCFSCCFCIGNSPPEDPWMEHTFNSPGCAYVRSMKGQDYIRHVLTQSKEGKDEKHPENSPDHAKSQKHSLVEKKYLDPSDLATRTDINGEIDVAIWTKIKEQIFSLTCESGKAIEETESDKCEIWTSDLMSSESARDKGNLDRNKHLPSNTKLEESDDEVPEIEHADSSSTEQIIYYTDISRRLESFIAMPSCEVAPDVCARAGFFFTGESLVCYSCCVSFDDWELEDPWMEHTIKSPGCDHVRSMKGQEYILYVLTKLTEGKDETNSENNPDHAKSQKDLLVEKKHLDSPGLATRTDINAGTVQGGKGDYAVRKLPYLGHLKLFDAIKGGKKPTVSLKTFKCHSVIVKYPYEASIRESKEDLTNRLTRKSKETSEFMRHLRQLSWDTQQEIHIHLYMVPDVMSRLSSYNIWPNRNIRTGPLVEAGFSCKDPNTSTVECKSCGLELNASALNGTTPMQYHREHSPDCEFFRQTNPQGLDGQRNRALADSLHNQAPSLIGINQEAVHSSVQQPPGNNQQRKLNQGQAQAEKTSEANDTSARARSGTNDGNIRIDEATSPTNRRQTENASSLFSNNEAASLDSLVAEGPRTGEVFDRATLIVPNNNNVTSSGEAMRENENIIAGAQGGEVPYPIRNSRFTEQNARRESYTHWPHRAAHDLDYLVNTGLFYTDEIPRIGNTTVLTEDEEEINLRDQPRIAGPYPYVDQ